MRKVKIISATTAREINPLEKPIATSLGIKLLCGINKNYKNDLAYWQKIEDSLKEYTIIGVKAWDENRTIVDFKKTEEGKRKFLSFCTIGSIHTAEINEELKACVLL